VVKLLELARDGERVMLSHRLDRETSGVLLLARTSEADRRIKVQFAQGAASINSNGAARSVYKEYVAITWGTPNEDSFRVALPLELDPTSRYGVKMRVAEPGTGLSSATNFEVVGRRTNLLTGRSYALVRCVLETGRQHQIRVHLAALGFPVVGDKLYGPDDGLFGRGADGELTEEDAVVLEMSRHALHAAVLEIDHPLEANRRMRIEAPLPQDMASFWEAQLTR
jgi:23S rRNA pseudouridine1911/1915/1917 synthase